MWMDWSGSHPCLRVFGVSSICLISLKTWHLWQLFPGLEPFDPPCICCKPYSSDQNTCVHKGLLKSLCDRAPSSKGSRQCHFYCLLGNSATLPRSALTSWFRRRMRSEGLGMLALLSALILPWGGWNSSAVELRSSRRCSDSISSCESVAVCNCLSSFNVKLLSALSFFYVCALKDWQPNSSFEGDHSCPPTMATSILRALCSLLAALLLTPTL